MQISCLGLSLFFFLFFAFSGVNAAAVQAEILTVKRLTTGKYEVLINKGKNHGIENQLKCEVRIKNMDTNNPLGSGSVKALLPGDETSIISVMASISPNRNRDVVIVHGVSQRNAELNGIKRDFNDKWSSYELRKAIRIIEKLPPHAHDLPWVVDARTRVSQMTDFFDAVTNNWETKPVVRFLDLCEKEVVNLPSPYDAFIQKEFLKPLREDWSVIIDDENKGRYVDALKGIIRFEKVFGKDNPYVTKKKKEIMTKIPAFATH